MYKCVECENLFEEGEQATWSEDRGEYWGAPSFEKMSGCPLCKGDYEEIKPCKICGSYEHETDEDFCKNCVIDIQKQFKTFISKFSTEEKELIEEMCGEWI